MVRQVHYEALILSLSKDDEEKEPAMNDMDRMLIEHECCKLMLNIANTSIIWRPMLYEPV